MAIARSALIAAISLAVAASASGQIVGFLEDFSTGDANWRGDSLASTLEWSGSGAPGGDAFVTSVFNLSGTTAGGFPATVIRAASSVGSSDGAYVGDWITAGVTGVCFWFRHDLAESIQLSLRVAPATNFPGGSAYGEVVAANEWTQVHFDLSPSSSQWVSFSGTSWAAVMQSIANIQIGFLVPESLAGQDVVGRFDMTDFSIVPAPAAFAFLALGGAFAARRRR
jgi:hypothetical protein